MIIAIDYDNTYSADPDTFNKVIECFRQGGHTVICITGRSANMGQPVLDSIGKLIPVIFSGPLYKREAAIKHGYMVNVWIDDMPEMVGSRRVIGENG